MRTRNFWRLAALLAALYTVRMALRMAEDARRYNHMLSLSNEGTLQEELPALLLQTMKTERATLKEWVNFLTSAPKELARYLKIETM